MHYIKTREDILVSPKMGCHTFVRSIDTSNARLLNYNTITDQGEDNNGTAYPHLLRNADSLNSFKNT